MQHNDRVIRALALWFFLVLLAVAATWVVIVLVNKYVYGPETTIRAYFAYMKNGDGPRALGAINADIPDGTNAALLDGAPLRSATETLDDVQISTVSQDAHSAVVRAEYTLDGDRQSAEYTLHSTETPWGVFTTWDAERTVLPTLTTSIPGATAVKINGVTADLHDSRQEFAAFGPGVYSVSSGSDYLQTDTHSVSFTTPGQKETVTLDAMPSQTMEEQISQLIADDLTTCTEHKTLYPPDCPFFYDFDGRVQGTPTWEIVEQPQPTLSFNPKNTDDQDPTWSLSPAEAVAQISFTSVDLYDGSTEEVIERVPFTYEAQIMVTSEEKVAVSR